VTGDTSRVSADEIASRLEDQVVLGSDLRVFVPLTPSSRVGRAYVRFRVHSVLQSLKSGLLRFAIIRALNDSRPSKRAHKGSEVG